MSKHFEDRTRVLTSGLGHKRTWRGQIMMSALPPKADIRPRDQDVCFGPRGDIHFEAACGRFYFASGLVSLCGRQNWNRAPLLPSDDAVS